MSALLYSHSCNNVMFVSDAFAITYRVNNLIIVPSFLSDKAFTPLCRVFLEV